MKNVRVFHELLRRGRLVLLLLLALLMRPPAARASYTCFYEGYHQPGGQPQRLGGHVDAATGAYLQTFTFNVLPNAGMPITAGLLYNSSDASLGPFGPGTSTPQDWFIVDDPTYGELLIGPGNVAYQFNHYDSNTGDFTDSFDPFLLQATLAPIPVWQGGGSALTWPDGHRWTFDTSGGLVQMLDGYGNGMNITRDATTGFVTTVAAIGSSGYVYYDLTDDFNGNHYGQVKTVFPGGAAHTWSCGYDGSQPSGYRKLLTLTQPDGNAWHFAYSTNYYRPGTFTSLMPIHTITDPRGNTAVTLTWDSSGRMTSVVYPSGHLTLSWNAAWGANGTVTATNAGGHSTATAFTWLANGLGYLPTSLTDNTLGETTTLAYGNLPSNYLQTARTDFRGRTTNFAWDNSTGHLLTRSWTTPLGNTATESFGYDPTSGGLTSSTDPLNRTTTDTVNACACVMSVTDPRGHTTSDTRDSHGNITAVTNALNQTSTMTYNGSAELLTSTDPLSHTTTRTYDSYLRPATVQDANGKTVSMTYDSMDRVLTTSQTVNGVVLTTTSVYDANGNRTQMTDPKGQVWTWSFDAMNRVTAATDPLGHSQTISYNSDGNVATVVDRDGNTVVDTYDTADRLTNKTFTKPGGAPDSTVNYTYDATTHLLDVIWDNAAQPSYWKWFFFYDSLDRVKEVDTPYGNILIGLNDKLNRRDSVQEGAQGLISYGFDNDDNITTIAQNGATASLTYDALNRLTGQSLPATPNPVSTAWVFDNAGFLTSVTSTRNGTTLDSHSYTRDAVGNILQETIGGANPGTSTFGYDDAYRLTSATVAGVNYTWSYDQVGNRLSQTAGGATTTYTYNAADQLTSVNGATVSSDLDGNVTNDGAGGVYTWDARGRLTGLTKGANTYVFKYGPDNLRTYKSVNGIVTQYMLDGDQVVTEKINGVANQTLYGPGTDHPLARNGEFFLPNHESSTTGLTDSSGNLTQSYRYGPFGELQNAPTDSNPFQYTGRENDGDGLLYYRARYYCPAWGRFLSADPAGFTSGANQYTYAGNNPVNHGDASGLTPDVPGEPEPPPPGYGEPDTDPTQPGNPNGIAPVTTPPPPSPPAPAAIPAAGDAPPPPPAAAEPAAAATNPDVTEGPYAGGTPVGNAQLVPLSGDVEPSPWLYGMPGLTNPYYGNCFVAGTPVAMADGSTKPIEAVQPGDWVLSRDPETGETAAKPVLRTFQRLHEGTLVLYLAGGEAIETTEGHPFFVAGCGWVLAGDLKVGDPIVSRAGPVVAVAQIERRSGTVEVYNFEVEGFHSYFVGCTDGGLWVHNISVFPNTPEEMDDAMGFEGIRQPDVDLGTGAPLPGRNRVDWNVSTPLGNMRITYEQHPYDTNAPLWHREPHWHVNLPGAHERYLPGDPFPG